MSRRRDDDPLARYVVEDKNEAVQAKSREVEVMHEEIAARRKARAEVAMLARRKAAAEARERRRKERAKRRKTRQKQLRRKERDKRKRAARREREKARAKAARAKARAQLIADGMLEEDPDNLDLDENSVVSLPNSEDDAQSDSPSVLSEVSEDTPDDVEADEVADGDLPPGGDVEMGVLEDHKELPERERQERLRDSMLEDYFAEYKECSTKLPLSHKEGNVELQRLCVALRFIIDEVGVRDRFLEDRGRELEEGDTVAEGSMMAAISHNSVVKIGREKAQRKKAKKKRRTPKSKPNPKPSPQPIAEEGPREGGGEGEGPGPDDSDSSDMELVPTKAAEKITRRHGGTRGRTRVRRAKRHKPSPKFPDMNEAVIDPHDRVNKVEDESPIAAISQEEPKDADVNQSFRTLLGSRRGGAGASAAKLNTAFGRDYERYVDPGVNEAETERFYQIWEDCQLETLDPFAEEFEAQCYSRTCEFLSERCIQQQEFLRTQLQDDPAIGSFTTEDLQAALHEQFHWRLQNLLLDMRRMERNPTSYHRGGFLYRVDNILAMLLYRRKDAVDEEEEKRIAAEAEQARMDERERIIYYNYIAGFFSYHKGKAATVLGALASVIIFGSLLIIWGAWRNTALVNLDKGMFHLSQANSARARVIAEDYVLQADAIRHHILSEFPRLQSSPRNMFETQAGDQGIGVPQGSETPSTFTNDPDGIIDRFLVGIVKRYNVKSVFAGVDTFEEHFICVRRIGTSTPTDSAPFDNSRLRVFATQVDDTTYSRDTTANLEEFSVDASGQRITGPGESFITSIDFNPFDLSHREWFPREVYGVSPSTKGHWTKPLGFFLDNTATSAFADEANDKPSIMYSFMVFGENGVQAGVFGVELWLPDLSAHLSEVDVFGTGAAYIAAPIVAASGDSISSWNMIASSVGQYDTTISLESRTGVPTATSSASSSGASRTTVQLLRSEIKTMDKYDSRVNNRDITYETKHDDDVFYVFSRAFDPRRAKEIGDASLLGCSRVPVDPNDAQVQMCLENWAIVTTVPQDDYLELIFTNTVLSFFIGCGAVATGFLTTKFSHRLIVLTQGLPTGGGKKQRTKKRKKKRKKKIVIDEDSLANGDSNGAPSLKQVEASSSESSSSSESEASFSYSESDESEDEAAAAAGGAKKKKKMVRKLRRMNSGRLVDMNQLKQVNAALIFCFLALVGSMLLVWALWNRTSNVQVKEIVDDLISETGERFSAEVRMPLALPTQILASVENAFSQPHAVSTESHDRLLFHLAVPFLGSNVGDARTIVRDTFVTRASDGQHSSISVYNPQTSPTSDHMPTYSVGFRNGSVASNDTTLAFRFSTRSADNSYCYTEYAMKPTGNPSRLDTLVRDESRVLFQSPACLYDARTETWFKRAVANSGQFVWSDPYIELDDLGEKTIMLTLSQSFQNATNATFVAGVHVAMPFMNEYLRRLRLEVGRAISDEPGANADPQAFILQRSADPAKQSGLVMASYSVHDHAKTRLDGLFRGTASNNDVTFSASKFFAQRPGGLLGLTKDQERVDRPLDDPITVLTLLDDCCSLPQFVVVINLPFEDYFAEFDRVFVLSFLLSLGIVICTIFVFKVAFTSFRSRILNKDDFRDILAEQKVLDEMSASVVPKKILLKLMRRIRKTVIEACAHQWRRRVWKRKQSLHPVHFDEVREHYALQAIRHINNSRDGRNILTLADLDSRGQDLSIEYDRTHDNRWPSRIYRVYSSVAYRLFIHGVIVLHIALFFQEPDTYQDLRDHGASSFVLSVEFLCLCAEFVDVVLRIVTTYHLKTRNFLSPPITVQTDIAYVVIYVLIAIDWGCTVLFDFSFEYLFPLRPLLLLMRNDSVRAAAYHFLRTIFYARNVFLLYLCIIVAGASMGTLLFRNTIVTNGPESSYENFIRSLTTTFVFVSTGENYTEIVYPAYRRSRLYILYFVTFCLFGMFFVLAMVIGMFQDGFQEQRRAQQRREQLFNRVGTVAAFVLMDLDGSEGLSKHEFQDFVMTLRPDITPTVTEQLFKRVDESGDDGIDVQEFVAGVEDILFERLILERNVAALSPWRVKFRLLVFEAEWVDFLVLLAVLVNVWLLSLYGTLKSERLMDTQGFFLLLFFVLEIGLKIWCYGWEEFWNYARYNGPKQAEQEEEQLVVDASSAAGKRMLEQQNRDRGSSDSSMNVDAQSEFGDGSSDAADGDDADSGDKPQSGLRSLLKRDEPREDEIAEQWSSKFGYSRPNREDPMREWRRAREAEREKQPDPDDQAMFPDASSSEEEDPRVQLRQEDELYRNEENIYRMYSNRVDFIIIAMSLFMAIVARIRVNSFTFDGHDSWRFVMTFPVLRLFTQIKRLRKLVFTLLKLFPRIASILVVVAVVFLLYGVIGVFYLHDAYEDLQDDAPEGNFTKLSEALLTLFQLLVGEGWQEVMYAAVKAKRGFGVSYYFISFVCVNTLLFVNVFIGIVLSSFSELFKRDRRKRVALQQSRLKRLIRANTFRDREERARVG